uniref:Uncharacterized protein n=1 Tax=Arundo donax TaxID=35708 RepID=A0A0A9H012_ARUDO
MGHCCVPILPFFRAAYKTTTVVRHNSQGLPLIRNKSRNCQNTELMKFPALFSISSVQVSIFEKY